MFKKVFSGIVYDRPFDWLRPILDVRVHRNVKKKKKKTPQELCDKAKSKTFVEASRPLVQTRSRVWPCGCVVTCMCCVKLKVSVRVNSSLAYCMCSVGYLHGDWSPLTQQYSQTQDRCLIVIQRTHPEMYELKVLEACKWSLAGCWENNLWYPKISKGCNVIVWNLFELIRLLEYLSPLPSVFGTI